MPTNEGKVVFTGDEKPLVDSAKKGEKGINRMGLAALAVRNDFKKMGEELGKTVGRALALKVALQSAAQGYKEFSAAAADAGRKTGASLIDRDLAANRLGISSDDAEAITGAVGVKSREDLTGFLGSLSSSKGAKQLGRQGVFRAANIYGSGVFSESEVIEAANNGQLDALMAQTGERTAALGADTRGEFAQRYGENALAARQFAADKARGAAQRQSQARYNALASESPIAAAVVGNLPGGIGAEITQGFQRALEGQTEDLTRAARQPTLAPGSDQ